MKKVDKSILEIDRNNHLNKILTYIMLFIDTILSVALGFILKAFMDTAINKDMESIKNVMIGFAIYLFAVAICLFLKSIFKQRYIYRALRQYKKSIFNKIINKDINFFNNEENGKFLSVLTNDMNTIETNYIINGFAIFKQISLFILSLLSMLYLSPVITCIVLFASIIPMVLSSIFGKKLLEMENYVSRFNMKFVTQIKDILDGFPVIKCFQAEIEVKGLFDDNCHITEDVKKEKRLWRDMIDGISLVTGYAVYLIVFGVGSYLTFKDLLTVGTMVAMIQLLTTVITPIQRLGALFADKKAAMALCDTIDKIMFQEVDESRCISIDRLENRITYEGVSLSFDSNRKVLDQINIQIEKGKSYIIVGESGSGKTTLVNLLLGYNQEYKGKILIDEHPLSTLNWESIYKIMSVVQQNVFIFDDSIKNNITMYKEFQQEDFENAVRMAGLLSLIEQKGDDYKCGETGKNLSGGEKQRISIARSILRESSVLIMDEATSALDKDTAVAVEESILNIKDLTRIIITHRLTPEILKQCDNIIVLKSGKIRECGSYSALMDKRGYLYEYLSK